MTMPNKKIAVTSDKELAQQAQAVASKLAIPYVTNSDPAEYEFMLSLKDSGLQLYKNDRDSLGPVFVDFLSDSLLYRIKSGGGKNQNIAKAVGIKGSIKPYIVDATAGLGKDAFILASLGCKVTMLERSGVISALLEDGLNRAKASGKLNEVIDRMTLINANSIEYLQSAEIIPDVIYLDPMFPDRKKTALVKKEMQLFKELLEGDTDSDLLLNTALNCAKYRVVVKRPKLAESLNDLKPDLKFEGKSGRFDVYIKKAMKPDYFS